MNILELFIDMKDIKQRETLPYRHINGLCWENRIIFPLKQNTNRVIRQIILKNNIEYYNRKESNIVPINRSE